MFAQMAGAVGALAFWMFLFFWLCSWRLYGLMMTLNTLYLGYIFFTEGFTRGWQFMIVALLLWAWLGALAVRAGRRRKARAEAAAD